MGGRFCGRWLACGVLLVALACGAPEPESSGPWRGEIVRIRADAFTMLEAVTPEVAYTIDGERGQSGPPLTNIADVARASGGRVALLDGQEQAVHLYGPDGDYLSTLGGRGQGPGEFTRARLVAVVGDTLAVSEWTGFHLFTLDGVHLSSERIDPGGPDARWTGITDLIGTEAGLLAVRTSMPPGALGQTPDSELKPYRDSILVQGWSAETSSFDSLYAFPGQFFPVVRRGGVGVEMFGPSAPFAISEEGRVVRVPGGDFAIEVLGKSGEVAQTLVSDVERTRVTRAHRDRLVSIARDQQMGREYEAMVRRMPVADYHAVIGEVLADRSGRVLVLRFDIGAVVDVSARLPTARSWDYLTLGGELLGRFVIPPNDRPVLLRDGYLHAIRTSDLGVPSLIVYDLAGGEG